MNRDPSPDYRGIVDKLLSEDPFSNWMGIEVIEANKGFCKVRCRIREEMVNGFGLTHGGILFSLADTALAFSAATLGRVAPAIDNSMSFAKKSVAGDILTATSASLNITHKTGLFEIRVENQKDLLIAMMKGTVYRTSQSLSQ